MNSIWFQTEEKTTTDSLNSIFLGVFNKDTVEIGISLNRTYILKTRLLYWSSSWIWPVHWIICPFQKRFKFKLPTWPCSCLIIKYYVFFIFILILIYFSDLYSYFPASISFYLRTIIFLFHNSLLCRYSMIIILIISIQNCLFFQKISEIKMSFRKINLQWHIFIH